MKRRLDDNDLNAPLQKWDKLSDIGEKAKLFTEQETNENYDQWKIVTDPGMIWEKVSNRKFLQNESI